MDDLISRRAAIEALNEVSEHYTGGGREWHPHVDFMIRAIEDLPSAQPEQNKTDFEIQIHAMFDHIWDCEIEHPVFQDTVGDLMEAVIQVHNNAAQPERNTGKWVIFPVDDKYGRRTGHHLIQCPHCGFSKQIWHSSKMPMFCECCGVDMRGDGRWLN